MRKFGSGVTDGQYRLARRFERAGVCTLSQAIKAFQRGDERSIARWKIELAQREALRQEDSAHMSRKIERIVDEIERRLPELLDDSADD